MLFNAIIFLPISTEDADTIKGSSSANINRKTIGLGLTLKRLTQSDIQR